MARIVLRTAQGQKTWKLQDKIITIGRSPANTITIDDRASSRKHCIIKEDEDSYTLIDLGSANGTHVNDRRIKEHLLQSQDRIRIGQTILIFEE